MVTHAVYEADYGKKGERLAHIPLLEKYRWYPERRCPHCNKKHLEMFYLDDIRQLQDVERLVCAVVTLA